MLELKNINFEKEANDLISPDGERNKILMDILELNEEIDEITNVSQVIDLEKKLFKIMNPFENQLEIAFNSNNTNDAVRIISKMKYYQNVYERLIELKLKFNLSD
jgi:hypothetical protein